MSFLSCAASYLTCEAPPDTTWKPDSALATLHLCCASSFLAASQVLAKGRHRIFSAAAGMHEASLILNPARRTSISEAWQEYLVTGSYPYMPCLVKGHSRDMPPPCTFSPFCCIFVVSYFRKQQQEEVTNQPKHLAKVHCEPKVARNLEGTGGCMLALCQKSIRSAGIH